MHRGGFPSAIAFFPISLLSTTLNRLNKIIRFIGDDVEILLRMIFDIVDSNDVMASKFS